MLPKPPSARAVASSSATSCQRRAQSPGPAPPGRSASPRSTVNGSLTGIQQDDLDLAAIILVDRAGAVRQHDAVAQRQPGARPDLQFVAVRQRARPARSGSAPGRRAATSPAHRPPPAGPCRRLRRSHRPAAAGPRRAAAGGRRWRRSCQRLGDALGQPPRHLRAWAGAASPRCRSAVTRCTAFSSPPMIPVAGETSLATIQSQPLRVSLACGVCHQRRRFRRQSRSPGGAGAGRAATAWPGCPGSAPAPAPGGARRAPS